MLDLEPCLNRSINQNRSGKILPLSGIIAGGIKIIESSLDVYE